MTVNNWRNVHWIQLTSLQSGKTVFSSKTTSCYANNTVLNKINLLKLVLLLKTFLYTLIIWRKKLSFSKLKFTVIYTSTKNIQLNNVSSLHSNIYYLVIEIVEFSYFTWMSGKILIFCHSLISIIYIYI